MTVWITLSSLQYAKQAVGDEEKEESKRRRVNHPILPLWDPLKCFFASALLKWKFSDHPSSVTLHFFAQEPSCSTPLTQRLPSSHYNHPQWANQQQKRQHHHHHHVIMVSSSSSSHPRNRSRARAKQAASVSRPFILSPLWVGWVAVAVDGWSWQKEGKTTSDGKAIRKEERCVVNNGFLSEEGKIKI